MPTLTDSDSGFDSDFATDSAYQTGLEIVLRISLIMYIGSKIYFRHRSKNSIQAHGWFSNVKIGDVKFSPRTWRWAQNRARQSFFLLGVFHKRERLRSCGLGMSSVALRYAVGLDAGL